MIPRLAAAATADVMSSAADDAGVQVFLVEDARAYRDALQILLHQDRRLCVIGGADAPWDVVRQVRQLGDSVVTLNAEADAARATALAVAANGSARLVVYGVPRREADVLRWADVPATALLLVDEPLDLLVTAVRQAAAGKTTCSADAAAVLLRERHRSASLRTENATAAPSLTDRQRAILRLVARRRSNPQIAKELVIATPTVKNHLHTIFEKLGVHSRDEAVRAAAALELI
jgi:DNA-binding NarL/FixJ family response regulator